MRTSSGTTEYRGNGLVPGIFSFPPVFWHALYASCFDTTVEEFGEKGAKGTKTFCNHLIRDILDRVHLGIDSEDVFLVIELMVTILVHAEGTGEDGDTVGGGQADVAR